MGEEFGEQFECLAENAEKYITFSIPIKKKLENGKIIRYRTKFIDSFTFISSSLSKVLLIIFLKDFTILIIFLKDLP